MIVIALFVGNDLVESLGEPTAAGPMQRWLDADQLLMVLVPRRLLALVAEGGGDARPAGGPRRGRPILSGCPGFARSRAFIPGHFVLGRPAGT